MALLSPTQSEFDNAVLGIAEYQVELASVAATMRANGDPEAWEREEQNMMLMNILDSLKFYDVDSTVLSSDDIVYMYELATQLIENCPI